MLIHFNSAEAQELLEKEKQEAEREAEKKEAERERLRIAAEGQLAS